MTSQQLNRFKTKFSSKHGRGSKAFGLLLVVSMFSVLGTGCQGTFPDPATLDRSRPDHPPYTLSPGDKLRVTVYDHENLSGNFTVDDAGRISLPLIRGISVRGFTLPELEQAIMERLMNNQIVDPKVSVDLLELRPFCIRGEVRNPGCFNYIHGMTVSKAIAIASGYTSRARKNEFVIYREDGRKVAGDHDTPVFTGDVIEVFERFY